MKLLSLKFAVSDAQHGLGKMTLTASDGTVEALAHRKTDRGVLRFYVPCRPTEPHSKIRGVLTMIDTNGNSVDHKFELKAKEA